MTASTDAFTYERSRRQVGHRGPEFTVSIDDGAVPIGTIERLRSDSWQARDRYSGAPVGVPRPTRAAAARLLRDRWRTT